MQDSLQEVPLPRVLTVKQLQQLHRQRESKSLKARAISKNFQLHYTIDSAVFD